MRAAILRKVIDGIEILKRMERAVERVRERLLRVTSLLNAAGIDYAVAGGHAVAAWVSTVDEAAVRNTRDVGLVVRERDIERMRAVLEPEGYRYRHVAGLDMFLDPEGTKAREAVYLVLPTIGRRRDSNFRASRTPCNSVPTRFSPWKRWSDRS